MGIASGGFLLLALNYLETYASALVMIVIWGNIMTICARYDGRRIKDCTRGLQGCLCAQELIDICERIAYPRRGSRDEDASIQEFADEIIMNNPISSFTYS